MKALLRWAVALSLALPLGQAAAGWNATVIYRFTKTSDAYSPVGGLVQDTAGRLYGAAFGGGEHKLGAVFVLTPPARGKTAWTESVLYSFAGGTADGAYPASPLIVDAAGRLFGVASTGGKNNAGTVFEIVPPPPGKSAWTERTIYDFDAANPVIERAALAQDAHGNLYFAAAPNGPSCIFGCGVIVRLTPPAKAGEAWKPTTLHSFTTMFDGSQPQAGLVLDDAGNLYGTTQAGGIGHYPFGDGVVFKLSPPKAGGTGWTENVLYRFKGGIDGLGPSTNLILDAAGNLYGATIGGGVGSCQVLIFAGCGTVFTLTRPTTGHASWTERVLHRFTGNDGANPQVPLALDQAGNLYGTNVAGGPSKISTIFELAKPKNANNPWGQTILMQVHHSADSAGLPTFGPVLTLGGNGEAYVTLPNAGQTGAGIVYELERQ